MVAAMTLLSLILVFSAFRPPGFLDRIILDPIVPATKTRLLTSSHDAAIATTTVAGSMSVDEPATERFSTAVEESTMKDEEGVVDFAAKRTEDAETSFVDAVSSRPLQYTSESNDLEGEIDKLKMNNETTTDMQKNENADFPATQVGLVKPLTPFPFQILTTMEQVEEIESRHF